MPSDTPIHRRQALLQLAASGALAAQDAPAPPPADLPHPSAPTGSDSGSLFPSLSQLREISRAIGFKVAQVARDEGTGRKLDDAKLEEALGRFIWYPDYPV